MFEKTRGCTLHDAYWTMCDKVPCRVGSFGCPFQLKKVKAHQVKTALLFLHINVTKSPQGNLFCKKNKTLDKVPKEVPV